MIQSIRNFAGGGDHFTRPEYALKDDEISIFKTNFVKNTKGP